MKSEANYLDFCPILVDFGRFWPPRAPRVVLVCSGVTPIFSQVVPGVYDAFSVFTTRFTVKNRYFLPVK